MSGEIVPFGKYKGRPVEALVEDRQHVDWLTAQPWFRDRFANIYTLIVNNFQEPTETPAHNRLQAMFLDETFRRQIFKYLYGEVFEKVSVSFEVGGFDVVIGSNAPEPKDLKAVWRGAAYSFEIKPTVGDDYPAVLRQIKAAQNARKTDFVFSAVPILLLEEYVGSGATLEQFVEIFKTSDIRVIFLDDVLDSQ